MESKPYLTVKVEVKFTFCEKSKLSGPSANICTQALLLKLLWGPARNGKNWGRLIAMFGACAQTTVIREKIPLLMSTLFKRLSNSNQTMKTRSGTSKEKFCTQLMTRCSEENCDLNYQTP